MREITTNRRIYGKKNHNQQFISEYSMEKCQEMRAIKMVCTGTMWKYVTGDKERSIWTSNYVNLQRMNRFCPRHIYVGVMICTLKIKWNDKQTINVV